MFIYFCRKRYARSLFYHLHPKSTNQRRCSVQGIIQVPIVFESNIDTGDVCVQTTDRKRRKRIGCFCRIIRITVINDVVFYQSVPFFVIVEFNVVNVNISNHITIFIRDDEMASI